MVVYDIKIYRYSTGHEGPTVRGLTYAQKEALVNGLNQWFVNYTVKTINKKGA